MSFYIDPRPFANYGFTAAKVAPIITLDPGPFSNTTEVSFHNLSSVAGDRVFIRCADLFAFMVVGQFTVMNSLVLMPGERISLTIGPEGNRLSLANTLQPPLDPNDTYNPLTNDYSFPRTVIQLVVDPAAASATIDVNVTYLQCRGYTGQGTQQT